MEKADEKHSFLTGLIVTALSFILLLVGVRYILGNILLFKNIVAYLTISLVFGIIAAIFQFFRPRIGFILYTISLTFGFFELYRIFLNDKSGWSDLAGFMTFIAWIIIGLAVSLIAQLMVYLYKRVTKHKES